MYVSSLGDLDLRLIMTQGVGLIRDKLDLLWRSCTLYKRV